MKPGPVIREAIIFYSSRLLGREFIADGTMAIRIERPSGFSFRAGSYIDLTIPDLRERDLLGPVRSLSISSPPESAELEFMVRLRPTAFKEGLVNYPIGTPLELEGPFDNLKLGSGPDPDRESVYIAGGIGIAPFLSALRSAALARRPLPVTLFYSNQRPGTTVSLSEIEGFRSTLPGFRPILTMTGASDSLEEWQGETRRLGPELYRDHLANLVDQQYYIAGSPTLITEQRMALMEVGVEYEDIRTELFTGY